MDLQVVISETTEEPNWDRFVIENNGGHYTQTALWGQVKEITGWKTLRIIFKNKHESIIAGAQILWKPIKFGMKYGYISKGPLFKSHDPSLITFVLLTIKNVCKEYRIIYLALQPNNDSCDLEDVLYEFGFIDCQEGDLEKSATIILDIAQDDEDILEQIRIKKRKWIRKAIQNPFVLREGSKDDLDTFYHLHAETGLRGGIAMQRLEFFHKLWDVFYPSRMVSLILCEYQGETICAAIMIGYKDTLEGYRRGWSGAHNKLHPNDALDWYILRWAREHGYRWFDFGGIDQKMADIVESTGEVPEKDLNTYSAYKLHYSHNIERFPKTYVFIYHSIFRFVYRLIGFSQPVNRVIKMIFYILLRRR